MKTLLITTSVDGGAGGATLRLHQSLRESGMKSVLLCADSDGNIEKQSELEGVIRPESIFKNDLPGFRRLGTLMSRYRVRIDRSPRILYRNRDRETLFSPNWIPEAIQDSVDEVDPDIINLHWIQDGFVRIESLPRFNRPIVWTLHDMWAFTGGCDYSGDCVRFTQECGCCPYLGSRRERDLSNRIVRRKLTAFQNLNLTIVTPSQWLGDLARSSTLLGDKRIEVIPNGIHLDKFRPEDRMVARQKLNLPLDKRLILCGAWAAEKRKGAHYLYEAVQKLAKLDDVHDVELVVFGAQQPARLPDLGIPIHYLGRLNETEMLRLSYSSANVFVAPSIQDNLPTTVLESFACGTSVVAYNIGGLPDMIDHKSTGYLAEPFDTDDLAKGIHWILRDTVRERKLSKLAHERAVRDYGQSLMGQRYASLFEDILGQ